MIKTVINRMKNKQLTQEYLRECFDYDPNTGEFTWLERPRHHFATVSGYRRFKSVQSGTKTGLSKIKGYPVVNFDGRIHQLHRLAFIYMTGKAPRVVDHINGVRDDNRWDNLRPSSTRKNSKNQALPRNNKSGHMGVSWVSDRRKWRAQIGANGTSKNLGYFNDINDAITARKKAESDLGFDRNHGAR